MMQDTPSPLWGPINATSFGRGFLLIFPNVDTGGYKPVSLTSLINWSVKRNRLVGGIPAFTLKKRTYPLDTTPEEQKQILELLMAEFCSSD